MRKLIYLSIKWLIIISLVITVASYALSFAIIIAMCVGIYYAVKKGIELYQVKRMEKQIAIDKEVNIANESSNQA